MRADRHYLRQIISNLLKNAVKFTHEGGIRIDVLPTSFSGGSSPHITPPMSIYVPEGDWVALRVSDTGIGIKPEDQEIIFESFRQVDSSTVREYGGPGLGLAISRRLVEMHEGYIWVDSEPDVGSTFTVLLPAVKLGLVDDLNLATVQRDHRPLVLVIDDGPADRQLLQDYLDPAEYQVVCTANPSGVQEIVRTLQPDMVHHRRDDAGGQRLGSAARPQGRRADGPYSGDRHLDPRPAKRGLRSRRGGLSGQAGRPRDAARSGAARAEGTVDLTASDRPNTLMSFPREREQPCYASFAPAFVLNYHRFSLQNNQRI